MVMLNNIYNKLTNKEKYLTNHINKHEKTSFLMCFFVCGIGSFFVPRSDFSPSPLYELSPYRRGGCSSIARQSKNSKRKPGFTLFFLLPYGVMAENQSFNNRLANDLLIDIKTNPLELIKVRKNV